MQLLALVLAASAVLVISYGGHLFWSWAIPRLSGKSKSLDVNSSIAAFAFMLVIMATGGSTFAQSTPTITFDLSPFFDSLNSYLPIFIGLFGIVGGIAGAMALARYVIGAVVRAFSGGSI